MGGTLCLEVVEIYKSLALALGFGCDKMPYQGGCSLAWVVGIWGTERSTFEGFMFS